VTRDLYDKFLRPTASEKERVWVGRSIILIATAVSLAFILIGHQPDSSVQGFMQMIVDMALFAVAFSVQLLPITLDMLFWKRGTKAAAIAGLATGIVCAFLFTSLFPMLAKVVPGFDGLLSVVNQCKQVLPIHATAWGLIPNAVLFVGISVLKGRPKDTM
jgi:sodium/proline symporter